ncbi:MAG: Sec-independent protein translocase protein TatB [Betaproteobacteria bacterium]|jgi:sec-independent protein translocase protein TatB|nr:Sec-independent protein translocase protein TatB [Betaproteobacteria bacterium]
MFDIGISEIMVIAVVALIVLGPEKLPKTARTLGHLFGRLQRYVADVKADINREFELEELKKLQAQVRTAATDFQSSMSAAATEIQSNVRAVETELDAAAAGSSAQAPATAPTAAPEMQSQSSPAAPAAPAAQDPPRQASLPGFDRG